MVPPLLVTRKANGVVLVTDDLSSHLIMPLLPYMKSSLDEIHPSLVLLFNLILWVRLSEPEMPRCFSTWLTFGLLFQCFGSWCTERIFALFFLPFPQPRHRLHSPPASALQCQSEVVYLATEVLVHCVLRSDGTPRKLGCSCVQTTGRPPEGARLGM